MARTYDVKDMRAKKQRKTWEVIVLSVVDRPEFEGRLEGSEGSLHSRRLPLAQVGEPQLP